MTGLEVFAARDDLLADDSPSARDLGCVPASPGAVDVTAHLTRMRAMFPPTQRRAETAR